MQCTQQVLQDRAARLHDPELKNKHDNETLEQQCKTRQLKAALERQQKLAEDDRLLAVNNHLTNQERLFQQEKLNKEREDLQFSIEQLRRDQAREWDINDPAYLAKMRPIRIDRVDCNGNVIIDTTLGVSSGQFFDGEDHEAKRRMLLQYEQFKQEMEAHMRQTSQKRALTEQERKDYEKKQLQMIHHLQDQEKMQQQIQREKNIQFCEENKQMAEIKREKARQDKIQETLEQKQHLENFANTRLMQETSRPGRIDEFKGFTKNTIEDFNNTIQQQINEAEEKRALYQKQKVEDEARELEVNRQLRIQEQMQQREKAALNRQIAEENRTQVKVHEIKKKTMTQNLGKNEIYDEFHNQFERYGR